jgi:rhamnose utilization protein RhaD (predicted bifunctional aldolase and dehydrogenase)
MIKSLWNETEAAGYTNDDLAMRVYTSRLLGADESLVLHGGGNTSVKSTITNIFGESEEIDYFVLVNVSEWFDVHNFILFLLFENFYFI